MSARLKSQFQRLDHAQTTDIATVYSKIFKNDKFSSSTLNVQFKSGLNGPR